jgi:serine/threonine-protein kinase HipA
MSRSAKVRLWGRRIGVVSLEEGAETAIFQYEPDFAASRIEVSPLAMPLATAPYAFPALEYDAFKGLPGLLADSLPDRYGNALFDAWLASEGRQDEGADAIERLCYTGRRGMGALEFEPEHGPQSPPPGEVELSRLVALAREILTERERFFTSLSEGREQEALTEILSVGTSAGGARAKAVIAWNPETDEIRSGQVDAAPGFEHWLLKFEVRGGEQVEELGEPQGFGAREYAYSRMAAAAGLTMSECRLLEESGRRHFMTRRFDRPGGNERLHMQSLAGLAHLDFNQVGAHSYEQALMAMRRLGLPTSEIEQQFRRMAFNVIARNQDDHVKNIAFLMDRDGRWSLSPAFDVTFAFKARGGRTGLHQMTVNGKRDQFTLEDFERCGDSASLKRGRASDIVGEVTEAIAAWPKYAEEARLPEAEAVRIGRAHRLDLPRG